MNGDRGTTMVSHRQLGAIALVVLVIALAALLSRKCGLTVAQGAGVGLLSVLAAAALYWAVLMVIVLFERRRR